MRVLILGATGMLGHKLAQIIGKTHDVFVGIRGEADVWPRSIPVAAVFPGIDVQDRGALLRLLNLTDPMVLLNAAGVVKQIVGSQDTAYTIAVNALYPNVLAEMCSDRGIRLVHYSTDCVFSGSATSTRGPTGYREEDPPDARDLYGLSKLLGEPNLPGVLVLRTSIIGHQLRGRQSLAEWFFAQGRGPIEGYTRALFSGLTTLELSCLTARLLDQHPQLSGLWHVAADPISKFDLLSMLNCHYRRGAVILPQHEFECDRRLDGARFTAATGWVAPPWPRLIEAMADDPLNYRDG